jgi:hypothetical protein
MARGRDVKFLALMDQEPLPLDAQRSHPPQGALRPCQSILWLDPAPSSAAALRWPMELEAGAYESTNLTAGAEMAIRIKLRASRKSPSTTLVGIDILR